MSDIKDVLDKYVDYLQINTTSSITTVKKYKSIVRLFLLDTAMEISLSKINEWISRKSRNKNTYVYKYAIKHFLISIGKKTWADSLITAKRGKRKKTFKYYAKEKVAQVINGIEAKYKGIALIQYKTGVRFSEAATIRAESIDFDISPKFVVIQLGKNKSLTKGSKERSVHLHKKYESFLRSFIKRPYGYVFLPEKCEDMTDEKMINYLSGYLSDYNVNLKKVGNWYHVEDLSSHYLRHLFADNFLRAGGDPVYLQKALGHSDIRTTMGYVSIQEKMVEKTLLGMEDD